MRLGSGNMQCEMPMAAKPQVGTNKTAWDIAVSQPWWSGFDGIQDVKFHSFFFSDVFLKQYGRSWLSC